MVIVVGVIFTSKAIAIGAIATASVAIGAAVAAHRQWVDATITDDDVLLERVHPAFTRTLGMRGTRLRSRR